MSQSSHPVREVPARAAGRVDGALAERDRIPAIDVVRLISILVVFALHLRNSDAVGLTTSSPTMAALWRAAAHNGTYGVYMFFVVSGFVITRTIVVRTPDLRALDLPGFYIRRAGRILPLFFLTCALGIGAIVLFERSDAYARCVRSDTAVFDAPFWASLGTFTFNWLRISRTGANQLGDFGLHWNVLWSLSIEEQFYLFYPLLLRTLARRFTVETRGRVLGIFLVLGPLSRFIAMRINPEEELYILTNSFSAFELLAMGALLCFWHQANEGKETRLSRFEPYIGVAGGLGMFATYVLVEPTWGLRGVFGPTAMGISVSAFMISALRQGWFKRGFVCTISYGGQYSYGGYLLHGLTLFALWGLMKGMPAFLAFGIYAVSVLVAAGLVHKFFETPINQKVRSLIRPKKPKVALVAVSE